MASCTKEEALETRCRILDAAEDMFHAQGVTRTSLTDVARAAGVTRGAIYWHFENKADLFSAMCERVRLPIEAMVDATADEREIDPLGQLRATCVFVLRDTVHNPHARKVMDIVYHKYECTDAVDPILLRQQDWYRQGMDNIRRILQRAVSQGQLPKSLDVRLAGIAFHASFHGLLSNWLFSPESFDLSGDAEKLVDSMIFTLQHASALQGK
ncbi:MAG: TetR family transcriptional regulator [Herminiimonas sp.]|nr:TetR family transcriptional regulator [Herminiimonas sp.]